MRLHAIGRCQTLPHPVIAKVTTSERPHGDREDYALLWNADNLPLDPGGYAAITTPLSVPSWRASVPVVHSLPLGESLSDGDVIYIGSDGFTRILYRRNSQYNFILLTEQCNSFCLMCSQPPRDVDDSDRIAGTLRLVDLIDPETKELGITGGEPTLFKNDFLRLIDHCKTRLPQTGLHVLTNGRLFFYDDFARKLGEIGHHDLMLGIPLYSDVDSEHDYVVQAKGAFEETIIGLHNLERSGVDIELRVVLHRQTYGRLPQLAEYISRNIPFARQVALMGMEMFGFVHKNFDELWIDPHDYQQELMAAVEILHNSGLRTLIYNHQLCVLDRTLWPFARKSISDWKNIYLEECESCVIREQCGGLFQSAARKHSRYIRALSTNESEQAAIDSRA